MNRYRRNVVCYNMIVIVSPYTSTYILYCMYVLQVCYIITSIQVCYITFAQICHIFLSNHHLCSNLSHLSLQSSSPFKSVTSVSQVITFSKCTHVFVPVDDPGLGIGSFAHCSFAHRSFARFAQIK